MNKYFSIIVSDLKNTRRDPTLLLIFWVPFLILGVVRFGVPLLESYLPVVGVYYNEIVTFFALLNAVFPGFILSFILLDEKDMQLLPAIKVTPVSLKGFLIARTLFILFFGFLGSILLLFGNGLIAISIPLIFSISLLCALNVPILVFIISAVAHNKVEGLTMLKVATVTLVIPAALFFIDSPLENLLAIFPAFWVYKIVASTAYQMLIFLTGLAVLSLYTFLGFIYANKNL